MNNAAIITETLTELLRQSDEDTPFVIIEHAASSKFIQFTGSLSESLFLDLPWQTLSEAEFHRAVIFFKRLGVAGEEYKLLDAPGGHPVAEQFSFQMKFNSVEEACKVVLSAFDEVYQFPGECDVSIQKSWDG